MWPLLKLYGIRGDYDFFNAIFNMLKMQCAVRLCILQHDLVSGLYRKGRSHFSCGLQSAHLQTIKM